MPKVKWGDIESTDIDDYEDSGYSVYTGPPVPNGVYAFEVVLCRQTESSKGNPQLQVLLKLDPREDRPDEKRYAGAPVMDFMPVLKQTNFRYVPFLHAIGATSKDFLNGTVTDPGSDKGDITKMGKVVPVGKIVWANVANEPDNKGQNRLNVKSYLSSDGEGDDDSGEADGEDAPF